MEQTGTNATSNEDCVGVISDITGAVINVCLMIATTILLSCFKNSNYATPYFGNRCGLITPFPFLEPSGHRSMVVAVFSLASINLAAYIFQLSFQINATVLVKVIGSSFIVALLCLTYLPILSCISVKGVTTSIIGMLYTLIILTLSLLQNAPTCRDVGPMLALAIIIVYMISLPSGMYLVIKFALRLCEGNTLSSTIASQLPSPDEVYVRSLLQHQNKFYEQSSWQKFCTRYFAYSNERGFQYSTTILVSITIGITCVTVLLGMYLGILSELLLALLAFSRRLEESNLLISQIFKQLFGVNPSKVTREMWEVACGGCLTALLVTYIFTIVSIFQIMKSYQHNSLRMARNQTTKLLNTNQMKPLDIMFSAVQYGGFQVAHLIWAFHVQAVVLSLVFTGVAMFALLLFTYGKWDILLTIVDFALPLIVVVGGTILLQWYLVKRYFLQNDRSQLAIANRRGFYAMMYFMLFYNALRGMFTCAARIIAAIIFAGWFFSRLDQSIFPRRFEKYDKGFLAFACLLRLEEMQSNRIMTTFLKAIKRNADEQTKLLINEPRLRSNNRGRKRWFLAWTLLHNPALKADRRHQYICQPLLGPSAQGSINASRENDYVC